MHGSFISIIFPIRVIVANMLCTAKKCQIVDGTRGHGDRRNQIRGSPLFYTYSALMTLVQLLLLILFEDE